MVQDTNATNSLAVHGERIRGSGVLGKSQPLNRLFDLLLERSLAGTAPKEIEIAQIVFGRSADLDPGADAGVRVHLHRLRKKLLELPLDEHGERLELLRGQYRLVVTRDDAAAASVPEPAMPGPVAPESVRGLVPVAAPARSPRWRGWPWALAAGLIVANAAGWGWQALHTARDARADSLLWRGVLDDSLPPVVVLGDRYLFGELSADGTVAREIADPRIASREDLDDDRQNHPQDVSKYADLNAHDLPEAMAPALTAIAPIITTGRPIGPGWLPETAMSRFTNDMLRTHHVVYLGLLGHLADLQEPISDISGFSLDAASQGLLVDRVTGHRYQSDWSDPSTRGVMRSDYAYLASLPGPSGNRVLVIAGTRDPGLVQAAQIAADPRELAALAARLGPVNAFEALYEVRTFGPSNVSARLLVARRLTVAPMWPDGRVGATAPSGPAR